MSHECLTPNGVQDVEHSTAGHREWPNPWTPIGSLSAHHQRVHTVAPNIRLRLAAELSALAALTPVFLLLAPRDGRVYASAAILFIVLLAFGARETRDRIWGPPAAPLPERSRHAAIAMLGFTLPGAAAFLLWGLSRGNTILQANLMLAFGLYFVWAFAQQLIFQFYLLGRLRALMPSAPPVAVSAINGIAYGLVHQPFSAITLATMVAGTVWSYTYYRDRLLLPLAASHAILGTTLYHWAIGRDLIGELGGLATG